MSLTIKTYADRLTMSRAAARHASQLVREAIDARGDARIVVATGASQVDFLDALTATPGVDWRRVEMFHLDEYVGLPIDHPASFRKYLLDRLIAKTGIVRYHLLDGEHDPTRTAEAAGRELRARSVDVAFVGIGENGHLAFNDPPADFLADEPYLIVELDDACRQQQVGEGWFASVDEVPSHAISMSVRQILRSRAIIAVVPDPRKAAAVQASVEGAVSPMTPASILRTHENTTLYLDRHSASRLSADSRGEILDNDAR